jgi:hypothetical protein
MDNLATWIQSNGGWPSRNRKAASHHEKVVGAVLENFEQDVKKGCATDEKLRKGFQIPGMAERVLSKLGDEHGDMKRRIRALVPSESARQTPEKLAGRKRCAAGDGLTPPKAKRIGAAPQFAEGACVRLKDLQQATQLNGTFGIVLSYIATAGRYDVELRLDSPVAEVKRVHEKNLELHQKPPKRRARGPPRLTEAMREEYRDAQQWIDKQVRIFGLPTPTSKPSSRLWNGCVGTLDKVFWSHCESGEFTLECLVWVGHKHVQVPMMNATLASDVSREPNWERFEVVPDSPATVMTLGQHVILGGALGQELQNLAGTVVARASSGCLTVQVGTKRIDIEPQHLRGLIEAPRGSSTAAEKARQQTIFAHLLTSCPMR